MGLCLYFLPMFESEADIVGAVNGGIFHQRVPVFQIELGERVRQGIEAFKEGINVGSLGLHRICRSELPVSKKENRGQRNFYKTDSEEGDREF